MKRLLLFFCLFLPSLVFCAEYGVLDTAVKNTSFSLTSRLLHYDTISYCTYSGEMGTDQQTLSLFFEAAFRRWTLGIANYIEKSGRAEKFPFVMSFLKKPIKLDYMGQCVKNSPRRADIEIISDIGECKPRKFNEGSQVTSYFIGGQGAKNYRPFVSRSAICIDIKFSPKEARARLQFDSPKMNLFKISEKRYKAVEEYIENLAKGIITPAPEDLKYHEVFFIMTHEVGHAFGLADEYYGARNICHNGLITPYRGEGIMNRNFLISPDDVNGMILAIHSIARKEISFKPFGDIPGMIENNKFIPAGQLPKASDIEISQKDEKILKRSLRISETDYKEILEKYSKLQISI